MSFTGKQWTVCMTCEKQHPHGKSWDLCSHCCLACYCSRECQRKGWKSHKPVCEGIRDVVQTSPPLHIHYQKVLMRWQKYVEPILHPAIFAVLNLALASPGPSLVDTHVAVIRLRPRTPITKVPRAGMFEIIEVKALTWAELLAKYGEDARGFRKDYESTRKMPRNDAWANRPLFGEFFECEKTMDHKKATFAHLPTHCITSVGVVASHDILIADEYRADWREYLSRSLMRPDIDEKLGQQTLLSSTCQLRMRMGRLGAFANDGDRVAEDEQADKEVEEWRAVCEASKGCRNGYHVDQLCELEALRLRLQGTL